MDTTPPDLTSCPSDVHKTVEAGISRIQVSWEEPSASDISGFVKLVDATHNSGEMFEVGSTRVSYTFVDGSNNMASCDFTVIVFEGIYSSLVIDIFKHISVLPFTN